MIAKFWHSCSWLIKWHSTFSIVTTFKGRKYTTVVGTDIPTKLVGTVYFDKSCFRPLQSQSSIHFFKAFLKLRNRILPRPIFIFWKCLSSFFDLGEENGSQQLKFNLVFFFWFRIEVPKIPNKSRKFPFLKRLHHFSKIFLKKLCVWYFLLIL